MPAIVRRHFGQLRDEALKRNSRYGVDGEEGRMEYAIWSAYLTLSLSFFHHELVAEASVSVASAARTGTLPTDLYVAIEADAYDQAGTTKHHSMEYKELKVLRAEGNQPAGKPQCWTRLKGTMVLDRAADANYTVKLAYYKVPAAPTFTSSSETSSELAVLWDEYIIQLALSFMWPAAWRFDLGGLQADTLLRWLSMNAQPGLREQQLPNIATLAQKQSHLGGAVG